MTNKIWLKKFTTREILIFFLSLLVILGTLISFFKKENRAIVITNIFDRSFAGIIESVHYYKDDFGPGIESKIKNFDTVFCFNGINSQHKVWYHDFATKGDSIYKKSLSDSFFIKRKDSIYSFKLIECKQYSSN